MSDQSKIEWTDTTWNIVTGCTKISPGCARCYIERTPPFRMQGRKFVKGHIPLQFHEDRLEQPLHWKKPRRVFVNSLSDLFHKDVPDEFIDRVFAVMGMCHDHTFQILTKREERMRDYLLSWPTLPGSLSSNRIQWRDRMEHDWLRRAEFNGRFLETIWPLPNVWLGVSVEDRQREDRIDVLRQVPAAVRFLSLEPLLEDLGELSLDGISWVIVGGESGPGARPCDLAWIRSIVAQCKAATVPPFVKQIGSEPYSLTDPVGAILQGSGSLYNVGTRPMAKAMGIPLKPYDRKGGDMAEWPEDLRVREFPGRLTGTAPTGDNLTRRKS